ncbi:MAG: hypothetical protein LH605_05770 [Microbacteriaceae bacterium]|nr:hypothetical protein [Microbacteriaceae bacterium]
MPSAAHGEVGEPAQPSPRVFRLITMLASPTGQPLARIRACRGGSHSVTLVVSSMTVGHTPAECAIRDHGAGQASAMARMPEAPTP